MTDAPTFEALETIFERILQIAITLGGLTAFIMFLVAGFKYLTSSGDPKQVQSASSTLTMAIIGLIVAIASWFILQFLSEFSGVPDLLDFSIVGP